MKTMLKTRPNEPSHFFKKQRPTRVNECLPNLLQILISLFFSYHPFAHRLSCISKKIRRETYQSGSYFFFFQQLLVQPGTSLHLLHPFGIMRRACFLVKTPLLEEPEVVTLPAGRFIVDEVGLAFAFTEVDAGFFIVEDLGFAVC